MKGQQGIKFLADCMLGRLAKWLRILGYDTIYLSSSKGRFPYLITRKEDRILLTRDTHLIRRSNIGGFLYIHSDHWEEQLKEIILVLGLNLKPSHKLFSRCSICNSLTSKADKINVQPFVPSYVFNNNNDFVYCSYCKKYYWKGTHWDKMNKKIVELLTSSSP